MTSFCPVLDLDLKIVILTTALHKGVYGVSEYEVLVVTLIHNLHKLQFEGAKKKKKSKMNITQYA